jgi:hypothetical protein
MSEQREETDQLDPEITHASDDTSRFRMAHEPQFSEVEILESPAPVENKARLAVLDCRAGGPRTPKGKTRSKHNALKHGLFSKVVLLKGEPRAEYDSLLNGLRDHLQPVGTLEILLVDRLATLFWRHRRLLIAEGAEIQKGREFFECDKYQDDSAAAEQEILRCRLPYSMGLIPAIANPAVLQRCLDQLEGLRASIRLSGFDPEQDKEILTEVYGPYSKGSLQKGLLQSYLMLFIGEGSPDEMFGPQGNPSLDNSANDFLRELEEEIERLNRYITNESARTKLLALSRSIPDATQMDRLLRYGTSLDREMDRTLKQLERLQRMRLGQPLAPPIDVNVSLEQ